MGQLRFVVNEPEALDEPRLRRAFVAGPDEAPFYSRVFMSGERLVAEHEGDTSGSFAIPWPVRGHGEWLVSTATLMAREAPYRLEVELARGAVFRVRNQLAGWELLGLVTPGALREATREATRLFARAATASDTPTAAGHAAAALSAAANASCRLADAYAEQALRLRLSQAERLPTLMGVALEGGSMPVEQSEALAGAMNLAAVRFDWKRVEATEGKRDWSTVDGCIALAGRLGLRVCGGPLLSFDDRTLPDWAYLWEGDFDTLSSLMLDHVRTTVEKYRGKVQLWNVASCVNRARVLSLTDEQRLQIVVGALQAVRQLDPKTPIVLGFDQPWAESLRNQPTGLTPLEVADSLERADLGVAGFALELNLGSGPYDTAPRSPLAFSRLVDAWNMQLQSPLLLSITVPSGPASGKGEGDPQWTPDRQAAWVRQCLPMLIAKNCIQVVVWGRLADEPSGAGPQLGVFDAEGKAKPVLGELRKIRESYLF